jgi:hypothetical protein
MMNILQFKVGGKYDYDVTFETGLEKQKTMTNDRPTGNLLNAISSVVVSAIKSFRFESIKAQFRSITFNYPEKGPDGFVLEFIIQTKDNIYMKHALKTERINIDIEDTSSNDSDFSMRIQQNNALVEKVVTLREEIEFYIKGARLQSELPFEDGEESEDDSEGSLFNDDEDEGDDDLNIVAGNISSFPKDGKK